MKRSLTPGRSRGAVPCLFPAAAGLALAVMAGPAIAQEEEITFDLVPNPKFVDCLGVPGQENPKARAHVVRGKLNDTLFLHLDGIRPGLAFDLFTVEHSPFLADGSPDPAFKPNDFGLAWYQSDIQIGKHTDGGRVTIKTILLDQIFGFDPDVSLPPTNTFHLGFWFNDPEDAKACGFDVTNPTPFNGEHKAGPLAMISLPNADSTLGPLCTNPDTSTTPPHCNP